MKREPKAFKRSGRSRNARKGQGNKGQGSAVVNGETTPDAKALADAGIKSGAPVRRHAATILQTIEDSGSRRFAADLIDVLSISGGLNARDRRFLYELVLGVLRARGILDAILKSYLHQPDEELTPIIRQNLRLALYQVLYLDGIPPHAAVSEAVKSVRRPAHMRAFVNGLLRTIVRDVKKVDKSQEVEGTTPRKRLEISPTKVCFFAKEVFSDPSIDKAGYLSEAYSHPKRMVTRWMNQFGEEKTVDLLKHNNLRPLTFLRVNRRKTKTEALIHNLHQQGVSAKEGTGEWQAVLGSPVPQLIKTNAFRRGMVSVQGAFAQKAVELLAPKTGERILELGAAPGGKTAQIAEYRDDQGLHIAVDVDKWKAGLIRESLKRLGLESPQVLTADAVALPFLSGAGSFDAVFLDAPCSNTGVLSRRPEARWRFNDGELKILVGLQEALLKSAASAVKPGGRLVYSTCSLEPEENDIQIQEFLRTHKKFKKVTEVHGFPSAESSDGGYVCVLHHS